jgi:hypothetical protein
MIWKSSQYTAEHAGFKARGYCGPCGPMSVLQAESGAACQHNLVSCCDVCSYFLAAYELQGIK